MYMRRLHMIVQDTLLTNNFKTVHYTQYKLDTQWYSKLNT